MKKILFSLLISLLSFKAFPQEWKLASGSKVEFKIKNAGVTVDGSFSSFTADIYFDPSNLSKSYFKGTVEAKSIDTDNNMRDNHLRGKDYFYIEKYSTLTFTSKKITSAGNGNYTITGDLKIRDKVKEISIPVSFSQNGDSGTFKASFKIDRRDFGVGGWSMILSDELTVNLMINVTK